MRRRSRAIVELAEKYDAMVMVDEAHGTGVFGANGAGVVAKLGLASRVLVQMGTLGKALGGFGAYVAGSRELCDLLINRCRSFIFTTSLPPAVMAMALAAIDLVQSEPERRAALQHNCQKLKQGLSRLGFELGKSDKSDLAADRRRCRALHGVCRAALLEQRRIRPGHSPADGAAGDFALAHYLDGDA